MRIVLNILWLLLAGVELVAAYALAGLIMCVLIITIPLGFQAFKLALFSLWPFGFAIVRNPDSVPGLSLLGNLLWIVLVGWWLALAHLAVAVLLAITIIGIPFALVNVRMARVALLPFGKEVVAREVADHRATIVAL